MKDASHKQHLKKLQRDGEYLQSQVCNYTIDIEKASEHLDQDAETLTAQDAELDSL